MLLRALLPALALALALGFVLGSAGSRPEALAETVPAAGHDLGPQPRAGATAAKKAHARGRAARSDAGARAGAVEAKGALSPVDPAAPWGVGVYDGVGAWVDMYDPAVLGNPWPSLLEMRENGVQTLYLETASWRVRPKRLDMKDRDGVELFLDQAHALGIEVVAWYLPGFDDLKMDIRRSRAAIEFETRRGHQRFDGFAADIEASNVRSIPARNRAALRYSRALRKIVGPEYALGAIVPDLRSSTVSPGLWPGLPYGRLAKLYDVFLPMAYSSLRGRGPAYVYRYSRENVARVRSFTRRPVHLIGGLTDALSAGEADAVVRGARDGGAVGASFYDFALGQDGAWRALQLYR
jgi:hypothetical protein